MAISVGVVSVAVGIGIPIFYETQIDNAVIFLLRNETVLVAFIYALEYKLEFCHL